MHRASAHRFVPGTVASSLSSAESGSMPAIMHSWRPWRRHRPRGLKVGGLTPLGVAESGCGMIRRNKCRLSLTVHRWVVIV